MLDIFYVHNLIDSVKFFLYFIHNPRKTINYSIYSVNDASVINNTEAINNAKLTKLRGGGVLGNREQERKNSFDYRRTTTNVPGVVQLYNF